MIDAATFRRPFSLLRVCAISVAGAAMLSKLSAVANFVVAAKKHIGDVGGMQQDQADIAVKIVQSEPHDTVEAAACLSALSSDQFVDAFTADQLKAIAVAIAGHSTSAPVKLARAQPQVHFYFHKYLTGSDWHKLRSDSNPFIKMEVLLMRAHAIGLIYPSELTIAAVLSVLRIVGVQLDTADTLSLVTDYKRINKRARPSSCRTMDAFPADPSEFMEKFPHCYKDEPPCQCVTDDNTAERARLATACRKTKGSSSQSKPSHTSSQSMQLNALTTALFQHMMSPNKFAQHTPVISYSPFPPRPKPVSPLSIKDKDPEDDSPLPESTTCTEDTGRGDVEGDMLGTTIAEIQASMAKKTGVAMPAATPAAKPEPSAKKRPATAPAMKRPAAAASSHEQPEGKRVKDAPQNGKPHVAVVASRSCVTARTGMPGNGMCKSIGYKNNAGKAESIEQAKAWLRKRCAELKINCDL